MARPRRIADETLLDAVSELLTREGPGALTFQSAAVATGLSPATLVQRFGSKDAMLRAALLRMWDELDATTAVLDAGQSLDTEGAIALLVRLSAGHGATADEAAQGLLLLREDFRDPALRLRGAAWGEALALALGRRLSGDPVRQLTLGRLLASQWQGALLWWGFSRHGTLRAHLRQELRTWCEIVARDGAGGRG